MSLASPQQVLKSPRDLFSWSRGDSGKEPHLEGSRADVM